MCLFTTFLTSPIISVIFPTHIRAAYEIADESMNKEKEDKDQNISNRAEEENGNGRTVSNDSSFITKSFDCNARLSLIIDKNDQVEGLLRFVNMFAPVKDENRLSVTAIRVMEASNTHRDKTLMLNSKGSTYFNLLK